MYKKFPLENYFTRKWIWSNIIVFILYYFSTKIGHTFAIFEDATLIWIPAGVSLAAFFIMGNRIWVAIFLASFILNYKNFSQIDLNFFAPILASITVSFGNTIQALIGYYFVEQFTNKTHPFKNIYNATLFIVFGAFLASTINSVIGVSVYCYYTETWEQFFPQFFGWVTGDIAGILIITPLFLNWDKDDISLFSTIKLIEFIILIILLFLLVPIIFTTEHFFPASLILPFIILFSTRYGRFESSLMLLFLFIVSTLVMKLEGVSTIFKKDTPNDPLISFIFLIIIIVITTIFISTILYTENQIKKDLLKKNEELNKWYQLTKNREERVVELKKEINELLNQSGKASKYLKK